MEFPGHVDVRVDSYEAFAPCGILKTTDNDTGTTGSLVSFRRLLLGLVVRETKKRISKSDVIRGEDDENE